MSANVKLGDDRLDDVDSVELENADAPGQYIPFYLNGESHEYSPGNGINIENDIISIRVDSNQFKFGSVRELKIKLGSGLTTESSEGITVDPNVVQSKLYASGTMQNIKTINGRSLLGVGNLNVGGGSQGISYQLVISVADWEGGTTVQKEVSGVTETSIVIVDTSNSNVECTAQGDGTLTFTATETPTSSVNVKITIFQSSQPIQTYNVRLSLSHCSGNNPETIVEDGASYENTITADSGYTLTDATVVIAMGDDDITSTAWDSANHKVSIANVTSDISISIAAVEEIATITKTLRHCSSQNSATTALIGETYSNRIIPDTHYHLNSLSSYTIEMWNGTSWVEQDVTFDNGALVIAIPAVTGDIRITVDADVDTFHVTGMLYNCHDQSQQTEVNTYVPYGSIYSNTITANENYTLEGATKVVNPLSAWDNVNHRIYVSYVQSDISFIITAAEITSYVAITRNLTGCLSTQLSPPTRTIKGQQYQESFVRSSPDYDLSEATVHISVGGIELTPTSSYWDYNNNVGTVTIPGDEVTGDIVMSIQAAEEPEEATVTKTLTYCSGSNTETSVNIGDSYTNTITANIGYTLNTSKGALVSIVMGGQPISAWSYDPVTGQGTISIPNVTGNIVISVMAAQVTYTVTKTLTHCTGNNDETSVLFGVEYENVITADNGYTVDTSSGAEVTITVSGVDRTAMYWDNANHKVYIPAVTGDINISISATETQPTGYVQFTAKQTNSQVSLKAADGASYKYSVDGSTWNSYTSETTVTLASVGDFVRFCGNNNTGVSYSSSNHSQFTMSGKIEASGNINYLLSPSGNAQLVQYCYESMFEGCTALTTAPTLPATQLAWYCYHRMFKGCTSLTTAPALPAMTAVFFCYRAMFEGCTSLTTAPELPATTLQAICYESMFSGCTSLTTAPALPATSVVQSCYAYMFRGCTSLTTAGRISATSTSDNCYLYMFTGCTSLNSITISTINWDADDTSDWLLNVAASGTLTCPTASTIPSNSASGIPTGWTRVNS